MRNYLYLTIRSLILSILIKYPEIQFDQHVNQ